LVSAANRSRNSFLTLPLAHPPARRTSLARSPSAKKKSSDAASLALFFVYIAVYTTPCRPERRLSV
jgi:hypothetical protein